MSEAISSHETLRSDSPPDPNKPSGMAHDEWEARKSLAGAYRVFDHLGWIELIFNHITLRLPGPQSHLLINPYGLMYSEITASNLIKIDLAGNKLSDSPWGINPAGLPIHSAIHEARPDAHCVMHTHTTTGMAVACMRDGLVNDNFYTSSLMHMLSYHDFQGITQEESEKESIVQDLGDKDLMILRNHGLLACGADVGKAFMNLWRLQRACDIQYAAHGMGETIKVSDAAVAQSNRAVRNNQNTNTSSMVFDAMIRIIEKQDPGYRL